MIITDWIHTIAGSLILVSLALGYEDSPIFLSTYWLLLTVFVGLNLFQYGISKFCPMELLLRKLGVREIR